MKNAIQPTADGTYTGVGKPVPIEGHAVITLEQVEDVRTLRVSQRDSADAGIGIPLWDIPHVQAGDRIVVTGRVPDNILMGVNWGIALMRDTSTEGQVAQYTYPAPLYSLSHVLGADDLDKMFYISTVHWGSIEPTMDFYVDSILILRRDKNFTAVKDHRNVLYSLKEDTTLQSDTYKEGHSFESSQYLVRSGEPNILITKWGESNALHITTRIRDYDGIDINLARLGLIPGNQYEIIVTGRMDGDVPEDAIITLMGLPGFSWRSQRAVTTDASFVLRHIFDPSEVEKWTALRVTTNRVGAYAQFFIYSIEIIRLG